MKRIFFPIAIFVFFISCKNEKTGSSSVPANIPSRRDSYGAVSERKKEFYKHFTGTIGIFPITIDLVKVLLSKQADSKPISSFIGYYYYDKYQKPIPLNSTIDSTGNLILEEFSQDTVSTRFVGKINDDGSYTGNWTNFSSKITLPFEFKENYSDGAIAFDLHSYDDSVKLWKNKKNSPLAHFDIQALLPSKNTDTNTTVFLKDKIFAQLQGDSLGKSYATMSLETLQKTQRDSFFKSYFKTLKNEKPAKSGKNGVFMNYGQSSTMSIIFNEKGLLSIGYGNFSYTGGAHGIHATIVKTYDLANKKVLMLKDVFKPDFEKTLNAALEKAIREKFNMKPEEPLNTHLFDNTIAYTTNFCLTKKGILFLYNPYEIAAYALGEIDLFIPFDELKSVLISNNSNY